MATSTRRTTTIARTDIRSVVSKHHSDNEECPDLLADLFIAYFCARKNKRNTASQMRFERNLSDNLLSLYDDIRSGRYKVGRSMCFIIRDPVVREVFAASFRDRIVHHLLYNWLMPVFEPTFIYDSYSCREGKGTLFGIRRLEHHIRSCSDNYRKECHVLRLDIEGYFMNINRQKLYDLVSSRLRSCFSSCSLPHARLSGFDYRLALRLLSLVIFNDPVNGCYRKGPVSDWDDLPPSKSLFSAPSGCGLPIGNLTSQLFSNIYLSGFDDYVKRVLKFRHYGRYVDDFYLVANSRHELLAAIPLIRNYLSSELGLRLHSRKIHLACVRQGARFLGADVKPHYSRVSLKGICRARTHMWDVVTTCLDPFKIRATMQSYRSHFSHFAGGCNRFVTVV